MAWTVIVRIHPSARKCAAAELGRKAGINTVQETLDEIRFPIQVPSALRDIRRSGGVPTRRPEKERWN